MGFPVCGLTPLRALRSVIENVPAPKGEDDAPLKALIFDSFYDPYKGVIIYFRVKDGKVKKFSY